MYCFVFTFTCHCKDISSYRGGFMVSALVSGRAVLLRALVGDIVLCSREDTLLSRCLSPPRCVNGYRRI